MPSKHKSANRTKDNARPASSSRSAELLGASLPQLIGLPLAEDFETPVDPNLQVMLKKMGKKDPTTKIKGLQELADFVTTADEELIKILLTLWSKYYANLATDVDNRTREAAHIAHCKIATRAGRNLAPHLRQLMGPWFTSQYDTYAPAASAALQAMKAAFPMEKFQQAIVYCQKEILSYIYNNLLVQTVENLTNKHVTPEEAELKYERIIVSCLQGYRLYLESVPLEQIRKNDDLHENIISSTNFWKYPKNKLPPIRSAWFSLTMTICQKAPHLFDGKEAKIVTTVLAGLDEKDTVVSGNVWECVLCVMSTIKEWHKYVDVEKMFYAKLRKTLRANNASSMIYPNLLPIISYLPPTVDEVNSDFYGSFFHDLNEGLKQKTNKTDVEAIAKAFTECLGYVVMKKQTDVPFCKNLIATYLLTTLERYLTNEETTYKTIFNNISVLLQRWEQLPAFLNFSFEIISDLLRNTLYNTKNYKNFDLNRIVSRHLELLILLKQPLVKKRFKARFSPEPGEEQRALPSEPVDKFYLTKVNDLACGLCKIYINYIEENQCKELLEFLLSVFDRFMNRKSVDTIFGCNALKFYDQLFSWFKNENLKCKYVIDIAFVLLLHLEEDDKIIILDKLEQLSTDNDALTWCISNALSHPHCSNPSVISWLKKDTISTYFVNSIENITNDDCDSNSLNIVKLALTERDDALLITDQTLQLMITKLVGALNDKKSVNNNCIALSCQIASIIYGESSRFNYGNELLIAMFTLSCHNVEMDQDYAYELRTGWQDAVTVLILQNHDLIHDLYKVISNEFLVNIEKIEIFIHIIVDLLKAIYISKPLNLTSHFDVITRNPTEGNDLEKICQLSEYVEGKFCFPQDKFDFSSGSLDNAHLWASWEFLVVAVLDENVWEEDMEDDEEEEKKKVKVLSVLDKPEEVVADVLHRWCILGSYVTYFKNANNFQTIRNYYEHMKEKLESLLSTFDKTIEDNFRRHLQVQSLKNGFFWTKVVETVYKLSLNSEPEIYVDYVAGIPDEFYLGYLHLVQVFYNNTKGDQLQWKCCDSVGKFRDFLGKLPKCEKSEDPEKKWQFVTGAFVVLTKLTKSQEMEVPIADAFGTISKFVVDDVASFFNYKTSSDICKLQANIEAARLCTSLIKSNFDHLSQRNWSCVVCALERWTSGCLNAQSHYRKPEFQALLSASIDLYVTIDDSLQNLKEDSVLISYSNEWRDILLEMLQKSYCDLWLYLADQLESNYNDPALHPLLCNFGKVIPNIRENFLLNTVDDIIKWTKFLKRSCSLLVSSHPVLQLWGYKTLLRLVPGLIRIDSEEVMVDMSKTKGLMVEELKEKLAETSGVVCGVLDGFKLGEDSCSVEPGTDSFSYTFGYLLLWDVLLRICEAAPTELRYQYVEFLRNNNYLNDFCDNLFRLMPAEALRCSRTVSDMFLRPPTLDFDDSHDGITIEALSCWLYTSVLTHLPAAVRQWWSGVDSRFSNVVNKVTSTFVSPHLCSRELAYVAESQGKFKNTTVRVMPSSRTVVATYAFEDAQVELTIILSVNYPLGGLDVHCDRPIKFTNHKQWLIQFQKCVVHQNGRIWDGLELWNSNLDRKFDGVEECYICFSVLHSGTYQLPKLACHTCKKKFHSPCLYKWFRTSYKSTCPICRNLFMFK